jgi:deoxyribonuclease V
MALRADAPHSGDRDHTDGVLDEWARERPELDLTPMGLTARVFRLSQILQQRMDDVCWRFGLDAGQFAVLAALRRAGAPFRLSPTELRRSLLLSAAAVTNRLYRLESEGLVERIADPKDRRSLLVRLTPAGATRVESAITAQIDNERTLLSSLDPEEVALVSQFLRRLLIGHEDYVVRRKRRGITEAGTSPGPRPSLVDDDAQSLGAAGGQQWWPDDRRGLERVQKRLARDVDEVEPWHVPRSQALQVGAVFVALPARDHPKSESTLAWAAAVVLEGGDVVATATATHRMRQSYQPGYLALSCGPLFEDVVRALSRRPDVLLVNACGRDHARGAGLAIHVGAALDIATVGITERPHLATSSEPGPDRGGWSPLSLRNRLVGFRLRTVAGAQPIAVHASWRTSPETAREVGLATTHMSRIPEPLQRARQLARWFRSEAQKNHSHTATLP